MGNCFLRKYDTLVQFTIYYKTTENNQTITFPQIGLAGSIYCYLVKDYDSGSILYISDEKQSIIVENAGTHKADIMCNYNRTLNGISFPDVPVYNVIIGDYTEELASGFMANQKSLTRMSFALSTNLLTTIGEDAFYGTSLSNSSITLERTIRYVGQGAFCNCSNLKKIKLDYGSVSNYYSIGSCGELISKISSGFSYPCGILCYPAGRLQTEYYTWQNNVDVCKSSFHGAKNLLYISFYDGIGSIYCEESPQHIGEGTPFDGCENLQSVYINGNNGNYFYSLNGMITKPLGNGYRLYFCPQCNKATSIGNGATIKSIELFAIKKNTFLRTIDISRTGYTASRMYYNPLMYCEALIGFYYYNNKTNTYNIFKPYLVSTNKVLVSFARAYVGTDNIIYKNDVDTIGHNAFYGTSQITVHVQNGITLFDDSIPDYVNVVRFD